jgi:type I protein arginine methyltransferase
MYLNMTNENSDYTILPRMKYETEEVWFPLSEDILAWDDDFHDLMLNDALRMRAYEKGIKEAVKKDSIVVDVGTGTGILSLWALEAGAKKVYGIEVNKNRIQRALKRITNAGFKDKFEIINALSYDVQLPERADLIISEILGNLADNEDMIRILNDAHNRFLSPEGKMLPLTTETYLVPVTSVKAHNQILGKNVKGINAAYDLNDLLSKLGISNQFDIYYDVIIPESSRLADSELVRVFKFDGTEEPEYESEHTFTIKKEGTFTGFQGYFIARLSDNVNLDISGDDIENRQTSDCWKHCYLPIQTSFSVSEGDIITLRFARHYPTLSNSPFRQCYSWGGSVKRNGAEVYSFQQRMC